MSEPDSAVARAIAWLKQTWHQAPPTLRRRWPWFIAGGALLGFLVVIAVRSTKPAHPGADGSANTAEGAAGSAAEGEADAPPGTTPVHPPLDPKATAATADAGAPLSPNVKLTFRTFPPRRASIMWGNKRLGFTDRGKPLVVERVRDSGPLDVTVRAQGYLTVHARAYTFNDAVVDVKITPLEKKDTIYGYQQPLADAGVPEITAP
ncbi:MAG TPA: hypothetical protein VMG12_44865 [Polyangiaceae bacterium]|nr:hypothetical protein [Polyangiaceae bacterium]